MRIIKNVFSFISIALLGILIIVVFWYNWPQKQEDKFLYLPDNSLAYGQFSVNWSQKGPAQLFDVFWQKMITANPQLNNSLIKKIVLSALPKDVLFSLSYDREYLRLNKQPDYCIIIDLGKKTRLINLSAKMVSYRGLRISNNLAILNSSGFGNRSLAIADLNGLKALFKPYAREELNIYLPNRQKALTALVKILEEKNNFAFFPSIDSVDYVQVSGNLVSADQIKGKMSFAAKYIADVDKIGLDAFFLNNLLMRSLLGYGLTYEGEVSSLANFVEINYQVKDLNKIWQQVQ
ncbi:MAG: hypothetical protein PHH44_02530 [bacterium]|nr:hypothetical protein [bacterium]